VVDVFINSLRNKLDPERELILTVRGVGYMVRTPEEGGEQ
jgi:DNA-binding response OmpR family regulator